MGIGTSKGAYYEDEGHYARSQLDKRYDGNIIPPKRQDNIDIDPDVLNPQDGTANDFNHLPPSTKTKDFKTDVSMKNGEMPFPDNKNPDTDFNNRFGKLPPSGILNDLKKPTEQPLLRKISETYSINPMQDVENGLLTMGGGPEKVGKAALRYKDETYEGQNHGYALGKIMDKHGDNINMKDIKDGFTTSSGRFVSREEAFTIAKKQDQIDPKVLPSLTKDSTMLLSEDLSN